MTGRPEVLIACSDPEGRRALTQALTGCGLKPVYALSVAGARSVLARGRVSLVFCAAELADGPYDEVLRAAKQAAHEVPVIVASHSDDTRQYLDAMRSGAFDYVATPCRPQEVERIVTHALHRTVAA
jgi:DNA-binding NtrC family response regulator